MTPDDDKSRLRRYVLGALPDEESAALEQQYFVDPDALDQVSVVEDELIEDYLEDRLSPPQREQFDRHYLATPGHQARVAIVRGLIATASRTDFAPALRESSGSEPAARSGVIEPLAEPLAPEPPGTHRGRAPGRWRSRFDAAGILPGRWTLFQQGTLAASLALVLGAGAIWLFMSRQGDVPQQTSTQATDVSQGASQAGSQTPAAGQGPPAPSSASPSGSSPSGSSASSGAGSPSSPATGSPAGSPAGSASTPPAAAPRAPVLVALSLSPVNVRGAGIDPSVTVPADADALLLRLEGDAGTPPLRRGRVVLRTVAGDEIWRGAVEAPRDARPGLLALVRLPASRLRTDDCIVELYGVDAGGRESELARYFVRIRVADRR